MMPLFALLVVLGGTGTILISQLGDKIGQILRENYDSVIYMRDLNEALERIDSSFQLRRPDEKRTLTNNTRQIGVCTTPPCLRSSTTSRCPVNENLRTN